MECQKSENAITVPYQKVVRICWSFMRQSAGVRHLCVKWRDGSTSWYALKDLKDYCPVETAEYAVAQEVDNEPAFNWGIKAMLKKRLIIISIVKNRNACYHNKNHKFGL